MKLRFALVTLAALTLPLTLQASAQPAGIQVAPVMLAIEPVRGTASFRVHNWRDRDTAFEVSAYRWRQDNGQDLLTPAPDVIVAPSTFVLGSQGEQIVRLAVTASAGAPTSGERSYRLLVRELPSDERPAQGFRLLMQVSMPAFITPRGAAPLLEAHRTASGGVVLANVGDAHAQFASISHPGGERWRDAPRYLLAGREVLLAGEPGVRELEIVYASPDQTTPVTQRLTIVGASDRR